MRPGRKACGSVCSTRGKTERCRERKAFSKWQQKLLRRRRGSILGLIVERWGPAGCTPVFEVLWRSSPSHKAPLALSSHPSPRLTSKGEDATWARPTVQGVNRMWLRAESPVRWHLPQSSVRHKSTACLCYTDGGRRPRREHIHVYHVSYLTFPMQQGQGAEHHHMYGVTEGKGKCHERRAEFLTFSRVGTLTKSCCTSVFEAHRIEINICRFLDTSHSFFITFFHLMRGGLWWEFHLRPTAVSVLRFTC